MREYILGVVGMALMFVVIDIILPEGRMGTFSKGILAVFLFFVVVSPIVGFFKKSGSYVDELSKTFDYDLSQENGVNLQVVGLKKQIEKSLLSNFGVVANVEIGYEEENGVAIIKKAEIWVEERTGDEHINEQESVRGHVAAMMRIEESEVFVYE